MSNERNPLHICISGSADFIRRMGSVTRQRALLGERTELIVNTSSIAEARSLVLEHRPRVFLTDIGFQTTASDAAWLRALLTQFRERFAEDIYIIIANTTPERFVLGGSLLFNDETSLAPSGLVDNLLISPPPGAVNEPSLEDQLLDCLKYVVELMESYPEKTLTLPTLADDSWVPALCDPSSREVWMRWLPRYSKYVNDNPLIVGPTGSGKTRLAAALHKLSGRKGPFVSITPRDFSSTELVQAELFGAVSGAYTGAVEKWGLVARAEKGTLFIDELQSIDRDLQGKLITFVENKTYRRVGEAESHQADVRFVFATNRNLQDLVDSGSLRDDFAYRLERLQLTLEPLEKRRLDISAGICFALGKVLRERAQGKIVSQSAKSGTERSSMLQGLTPEAYRLLFASAWPGNLRQLENTVAKLVELADIRNESLIDGRSVLDALEGTLGRKLITAGDLFANAARKVMTQAQTEGFATLDACSAYFNETARLNALDLSGGDVDKASALIGDSKKKMSLLVAAREGKI